MPVSRMPYSVISLHRDACLRMNNCRTGLLLFSFGLIHVKFGWFDINYSVLKFTKDIPPYLVVIRRSNRPLLRYDVLYV